MKNVRIWITIGPKDISEMIFIEIESSHNKDKGENVPKTDEGGHDKTNASKELKA